MLRYISLFKQVLHFIKLTDFSKRDFNKINYTICQLSQTCYKQCRYLKLCLPFTPSSGRISCLLYRLMFSLSILLVCIFLNSGISLCEEYVVGITKKSCFSLSSNNSEIIKITEISNLFFTPKFIFEL